jgi:hypothetical protein
MMVGGDHLGNVSSIEFLQQALRRAVRSPAPDVPVLWKQVIYSGVHCGDPLTLVNVFRLDDELGRLRKVDFAELMLKSDDLAYIRQFRETLTSIVKTAIKIKKPVAF